MTKYNNKRIVLASRPDGVPTANNFKIDESSIIDTENIKDGEIVVQTKYISLDPYLIMTFGRAGRDPDQAPQDKNDDSSMKLNQFKAAARLTSIGECILGRGVGRVVASKHASVKEGDSVAADWGWQEYAVVNVDEEPTFERLEKDVFDAPDNTAPSLSTALGVLSVSGAHALYGFQHCNIHEGDTIVISAGGGNIGIIVGQLAKMKGARVVGIAGGEDKCRRLKEELGYDAVVDYRPVKDDVKELTRLIGEACPRGVDAYFDNVAGTVSNAVNNNINENARVYLCGAISQYPKGGGVQFTEEAEAVYKKKNVDYVSCISSGSRYLSRIPESRRELFGYMKEGKLKPVEWITKGIEKTPEVFEGLYKGQNYGKTLVQVSD